MARMSKRERERIIHETDMLLADVMAEHSEATGHDGVTLWSGIGWGCPQCDPDIFDPEQRILGDDLEERS